MATPAQIKTIHVLKTKLHLLDHDYRSMLSSFHVESSKSLTVSDAAEFIDVLIARAKDHGAWKKSSKKPSKLSSADCATKAQQAKILAIWNGVSRAPEDKRREALNTFLYNRFGTDRLEWLTIGMVGPVIHTLTRMQQQKENGSEPKN